MWAWLANIVGAGAGAASSSPLMGIPSAAEQIARTIGKSLDVKTEADRAATLRAIAAELHKNADVIDDAIAKANEKKKTVHITLPPAVAVMALFALGSLGCASVPPRDSATPTGNVGRLLARPDFKDAAVAAPEWTRDALKTVNSLEGRIQEEVARANQVR